VSPFLRLPDPANRETTRSAPAENVLTGTTDGVSSQGPPILPPISGKGAEQIVPPHPSHPIMRRLGSDLEEKPEPRVASSAEAQMGDGMRPSE
jgi:hypothetical protein